jgi:hypothetical protein
MSASFELLLNQIEAFIRKYYINRMLKGALFFVGAFVLSFLFVSVFEYFGRFNSLVRGFLFFAFVLSNLYVLIFYVIVPLLNLYSFGKRINRLQAAEIIGTFFPEISDRLKNTLQLEVDLVSQTGNLELLRASVQQRSEQLSVVPFANAINLGDNRKYARFLIPVFCVFVIIAVAAPKWLTQGTERVVNYDKEFKPEAPFSFVLLNNDLTIEEGEDLPVEVLLKGSGLPDQLYLISENGKFLMKKVRKNRFKGVIKRPKESSSFRFEANDFYSKDFHLTVFGKSSLGRLQAVIDYPAYTGKTDEIIQNAGDLTVPEGTLIKWDVVTKNTEITYVKVNDKVSGFKSSAFTFLKKASNALNVEILLKNRFKSSQDKSSFTVDVVKDDFPTISVDESADSTSDGVRLFVGRCGDDYGVSGLTFVYTIHSEDGKTRTNKMSVKRVSGMEVPFDFAVDFRRENVKLKDRIDYFFVVNDNDGVNGSKSTKSQTFSYRLPSLEELNEQREEDQKDIQNDLGSLLKKTQDFQKKVDKLKKDVLNNKANDWNRLNQIEQLKNEQESIQHNLEQLQNQMNESIQEKDQLSEMDKELMEKQQMIEELLKEVMDDELMKLLEELEKLMEKNDKDGLKDKLEDIDQSNENMKNQLDRSLEMLKRLQVNEKIDDVEKELKSLANEQEELKKEVDSGKLSTEDAAKKQDDLNQRFNELKEDLKELKELNNSLSDPMDLGNQEPMSEEITKEMQEAKEGLQNGKLKKAGEKQQSASDKMEEMAEQLDAMQQQSNQQQQEEDMNSIRTILESLMTLSFEQEDVMRRFAKVKDADPAYRRYGRRQRKIIDDTKLVRDSLLALAKRQPKIASFVDKELLTIQQNHDLSLEDIDEHRKRELGVHQQLVMTSFNNLALLLNESLQSMQQQMQGNMQNSGSCNNPNGKGQPKPGNSMNSGDMKQMLKKQLEQMQKGQNPNGDKPGNKPGQGAGQGMNGLGNKEIAKMAAEQTAIRQRLEKLKNEMNKEGQGKGNQLNPLIKELEQQEKDLINKRFNQQMINRQKDILTRLLESEKALMERGFEEKRESVSGKNMNGGNQIRFDEYNKLKLKQIELLRTVDPVYKKYYKDKATDYFNQ